MGDLNLKAASGGQIALTPTNTASNYTLTLPARTGNIITSADSGTVTGTMIASLPVGSVVQVVSASYSTATSSTSTTYATSGLSASITPKSSSNKILVLMNISNIQTNNAGNGCNIQIWRGGSSIVQPGIVTGYLSGVTPNYILISGGFCSSYLDAPATTSSTTYTVYFSANTAGQTVSIHVNNSTSTMSLLEVAA